MIWLMVVSFFFLSNYILLIILLISGLKKLQIPKKSENKPVNVSIVIPFRDEQANLPALLDSLGKLNVSDKVVEVVFVNDHSSDGSEILIRHFTMRATNMTVQLINLSELPNLSGKKDAQKAGVDAATHDNILFTDADCIFRPDWISSMMRNAENEVLMVCGFVEFIRKPGFLQWFFYTEFMSLVLTSAGAFGIQRPVFCNGANMLMQKKIFLSLYHKIGGKRFASGDDVFLLHSVISEYGNHAAVFAFSGDCRVQTKPPEKFIEFLNQRIRWASKTSSYRDGFSVYMALTVFLFCLSIPLMFAASIIYSKLLPVAILILTVKVILDATFFYSGKSIHKVNILHMISIPFQIIYVPYIVLTAILSFILPGKWKDRRIIRR